MRTNHCFFRFRVVGFTFEGFWSLVGNNLGIVGGLILGVLQGSNLPIPAKHENGPWNFQA